MHVLTKAVRRVAVEADGARRHQEKRDRLAPLKVCSPGCPKRTGKVSVCEQMNCQKWGVFFGGFVGVLYFFCVLCGSVVVFVLADKGRGLSSPDLVKRCAAPQPACAEAGRLCELGAPRCAWQRAGCLAWLGRRAWRGGLFVFEFTLARNELQAARRCERNQ